MLKMKDLLGVKFVRSVVSNFSSMEVDTDLIIQAQVLVIGTSVNLAISNLDSLLANLVARRNSGDSVAGSSEYSTYVL